MPSPYRTKPYPLSRLNDHRMLVRVRCTYCKRQHNYYPDDLIQIFGDVDVDSLMQRMVCENGRHGSMDVNAFIRLLRQGLCSWTVQEALHIAGPIRCGTADIGNEILGLRGIRFVPFQGIVDPDEL